MNFFTPAEVAKNYIGAGKAKVNTPISKMLLLAVLAGAFIAMGGVGATTVAVSVPLASVGKFVGACVFPGGLTMVLLAGSELFTGNTLLVIPLLQKEITPAGMLKNWGVVYLGNLAGGLLVAAGVVYSHQPDLFGKQMAVSVISTAAAKCSGIQEYGDAAAAAGVDMGAITWGNFFGANLLPVTIGNIIGGAVCVGCVYWYIYLRKADR